MANLPNVRGIDDNIGQMPFKLGLGEAAQRRVQNVVANDTRQSWRNYTGLTFSAHGPFLPRPSV